MKNLFSRISLLLAFGGTPIFATAQASADLAMIGTITPPACHLGLDKPVLDFGRIAYANLKDEGTSLGNQDLTLTVNCEGPVRTAWSLSDNRVGSQIDLTNVSSTVFPLLATNGVGENSLGLGTTQDSKVRIGAMRMALLPGALFDGNVQSNAVGRVIGSRNLNFIPTGAPAIGASADSFRLGTAGFFSYGTLAREPGGQFSIGTVLPYKTATLPLRVNAFVAPRRDLPATEEITLDGSVTFTLHYL